MASGMTRLQRIICGIFFADKIRFSKFGPIAAGGPQQWRRFRLGPRLPAGAAKKQRSVIIPPKL
jgi:hypothetical protein